MFPAASPTQEYISTVTSFVKIKPTNKTKTNHNNNIQVHVNRITHMKRSFKQELKKNSLSATCYLCHRNRTTPALHPHT
jgi:hypothetical protein